MRNFWILIITICFSLQAGTWSLYDTVYSKDREQGVGLFGGSIWSRIGKASGWKKLRIADGVSENYIPVKSGDTLKNSVLSESFDTLKVAGGIKNDSGFTNYGKYGTNYNGYWFASPPATSENKWIRAVTVILDTFNYSGANLTAYINGKVSSSSDCRGDVMLKATFESGMSGITGYTLLFDKVTKNGAVSTSYDSVVMVRKTSSKPETCYIYLRANGNYVQETSYSGWSNGYKFKTIFHKGNITYEDTLPAGTKYPVNDTGYALYTASKKAEWFGPVKSPSSGILIRTSIDSVSGFSTGDRYINLSYSLGGGFPDPNVATISTRFGGYYFAPTSFISPLTTRGIDSLEYGFKDGKVVIYLWVSANASYKIGGYFNLLYDNLLSTINSAKDTVYPVTSFTWVSRALKVGTRSVHVNWKEGKIQKFSSLGTTDTSCITEDADTMKIVNKKTRLVGTSIMWEDLNFAVIRSGGPVETRPDDVTIDNIYYKEFTSLNNQTCGDEQEIPHSACLATPLYPHAHGFLKAGESSGTTGATFRLYYQIRTSTNTIQGYFDFTKTSAELAANPRIVDFYGSASDTIKSPGTLGAQLGMRIGRIAGNAGDIIITTYGVHYAVDGFGSSSVTTK